MSSQRSHAITALEYSWTRAAYSCPAARGVIGSSLSRLSYSSSTAFRRVRALVTELYSVARSGTAMGHQSSTIEEARLCQIGQTHLRAPRPSSPKAGIQSDRDVVLPPRAPELRSGSSGRQSVILGCTLASHSSAFGIDDPRQSPDGPASGEPKERSIRHFRRKESYGSPSASVFGARRFSIFSQPDCVRKILREKLNNLVVGSDACLRGSRKGG